MRQVPAFKRGQSEGLGLATLGQAIAALEEQLFVGREPELATFRHWLTAVPAPPEILVVSGPGGVGKTALVGAFRRQARVEGRHVVDVDGQHLRPTPRAFLIALGGGPLQSAIPRLNDAQAVLLIDSFERLAQLSTFLRERFLPRLDSEVRVVFASRQPLTTLWQRDDVWHKLVRAMPLEGLSQAESHAYLKHRGLGDRKLVMDQIPRATAGHPLALSLAADLALRLDMASFDGVPEWHLVVRALVDRLRETEDADVRELLECASVIREFDEATLLAVADRVMDPIAFARLCALSIVRPTAHGLTLHEDVRHLLAEDLRWRDADRHAALRQRARAYFRKRAHTSGTAERARLMCEQIFLSEQDEVRRALFGDQELARVQVGPPRPADRGALEQLWQDWVGQHGEEDGFVRTLLESPGVRVRVARNQRHQVLGFAAAVPLSKDCMPLVQHNPAVEDLVGGYLWKRSDSLPDVPEASRLFWHTQVARREPAASATLAALLRESIEIFAQGGVHLTMSSSALPQHKLALEALGFEPIGPRGPGDAASRGYVLDLLRVGVDSWVNSLAATRAAAHGLPRTELEQELQTALAHWGDDAWLSGSKLLGASFMSAGPGHLDIPWMREYVAGVLSQLATKGGADERLACRAVLLAYLTPRVSHLEAMEQLAVSRATFYRLLKRGVQRLAARLADETA